MIYSSGFMQHFIIQYIILYQNEIFPPGYFSGGFYFIPLVKILSSSRPIVKKITFKKYLIFLDKYGIIYMSGGEEILQNA